MNENKTIENLYFRPGLQQKSGSNFDVVKKAIIYLKKQGYELFVLISKNYSKEVIKELEKYGVKVIPVFSVTPYNRFFFPAI